MDKVQKPGNSHYYTSSLEPFSIWLLSRFPHGTRWRAKTKKFIIMKLSQFPSHCVAFIFKYSLKHFWYKIFTISVSPSKSGYKHFIIIENDWKRCVHNRPTHYTHPHHTHHRHTTDTPHTHTHHIHTYHTHHTTYTHTTHTPRTHTTHITHTPHTPHTHIQCM
jgi:hypothetical protein